MKNTLIALFFLILTPLFLLAQTIDTTAIGQEVNNLLYQSQDLAGQQKIEEAFERIEQAKARVTSTLGQNHIFYAVCLSFHAKISDYLGQFKEAEDLYLEALSIYEKAVGKEHPRFALTQNLLGGVYHKMGRYEDALQNYLDAKIVLENFFGTEHPNYAANLNNIAILYRDIGEYEKAEQLYLEVNAIDEKTSGKKSSEYAGSLNNLGVLYRDMGQYEKSERVLLEAIAIKKDTLGRSDFSVGETLSNLASLYRNMGDFEKSEWYALEALNIFEKLLGREHYYTAKTLLVLTNLYIQMGNYEKVEPIFLEANSTLENTLGKTHSDYATSLQSLAGFYFRVAEYEKAEAYYLQARNILEEGVGKEHPNYAKCLNYLGILYKAIGEYEKAEQYYLESIAILEKALGKTHHSYALSLFNLGGLYQLKGDYEKGQSLFLESIAIMDKSLDKSHLDYVNSLQGLAILYKETGNLKKASALFQEASVGQKDLLIRASRHASEVELAAYQKKFVADLSKVFSFTQNYPQTELELNGLCFDHALFYKGFLLNNSNQIKRLANTDSVSIEKYNLLTSYHRRLAVEYSKPLAERKGVESLEEKANTLEKELARQVAGFDQTLQQVSWQEVQGQLKPGEAAIEFVHYQFYHPQLTDSTMYAALILKPGSEAPRFIPMFEEKEIEVLLQGQQSDRNKAVNSLYAFAGRGVRPQKIASKTLLELNWKPLEQELENVHTLYYAPSGLLHRMNFAAIAINKKERLGDKYRLVQFSSTRQLVIPHPEYSYKEDAVLFGGINYEMDSTAILMANAGEVKNEIASRGNLSSGQMDRSLQEEAWPYLTWTGIEVETVEEIFQKTQFKTISNTGFAATEEAFRQIGVEKPSPRVLHLATHGFFFPDPVDSVGSMQYAVSSSSEPIFKISDHPMIRSGLILAGANHVWQGNPPIENMEDGILTAYEISQMDLFNTELVVLSACETGLGDIEGNEGVYGLQRAFRIAGAKYLIMSLWQVPDKETMEFMEAFYQNWLGEELTIPEAFRATQKQMREKYQDPYAWAAFVLVE